MRNAGGGGSWEKSSVSAHQIQVIDAAVNHERLTFGVSLLANCGPTIVRFQLQIEHVATLLGCQSFTEHSVNPVNLTVRAASLGEETSENIGILRPELCGVKRNRQRHDFSAP